MVLIAAKLARVAAGFQISLNYLMELDEQLTSNSARAYVGWEEGSMERRRISLVPGQRKPGRAHFRDLI